MVDLGEEESFERRILSGRLRLIRRTSRSALCKGGNHELCNGTFQDATRDPIAHRKRGLIKCDCECEHKRKGSGSPS